MRRAIPAVVGYAPDAKPLSAIERAFAAEILKGANYQQAAFALGFAKSQGSKIACRKHVARFIADSLAKIEAEEAAAKAKAEEAWEAGHRAALTGARSPEEIKARSDAYPEMPEPVETEHQRACREEAGRTFMALLREREIQASREPITKARSLA